MTEPTQAADAGRRKPWHGRHRAILAALLALVALTAGLVLDVAQGGGNGSAKDRIGADPPPALFTDAQVAPTEQSVADVRAQAREVFATWIAAHGTHADDKAFATWVAHTFPPRRRTWRRRCPP